MQCECEIEFRNCLNRVGGVARLVGFSYFSSTCYSINKYGDTSLDKFVYSEWLRPVDDFIDFLMRIFSS